jgi:hypothetical protein
VVAPGSCGPSPSSPVPLRPHLPSWLPSGVPARSPASSPGRPLSSPALASQSGAPAGDAVGGEIQARGDGAGWGGAPRRAGLRAHFLLAAGRQRHPLVGVIAGSGALCSYPAMHPVHVLTWTSLSAATKASARGLPSALHPRVILPLRATSSACLCAANMAPFAICSS